MEGSPKRSGQKKKTEGLQKDRARQARRPPPPNSHALQAGIKEFLESSTGQSVLEQNKINPGSLEALPKRFTIYEPLLLLPANSFTAPPPWGAVYAVLTSDQREALYASIAKSFRRLGVTHVAMNAPIALNNLKGAENRMRSPAGLVPLYGDFKVSSLVSTEGGENCQPSKRDLEDAFWVQTAQNHGIKQTWAPLYTMFSRGNITEKARILDKGPSANTFEGLDTASLQGQPVSEISIVDMYAGIGYFVFSYLKRGVKRVWGWELNGWSVEGLRRGCGANKWGCKVFRVHDNGQMDISIPDLVTSLSDSDRVVVFHGDNTFASEIMTRVQRELSKKENWSTIRHVNLGLLPSSQQSWDNACRALDLWQGGWLHVHENVDVRCIEEKKDEIIRELTYFRAQVYTQQGISQAPVLECDHVEHVKTYAPGVMHCVFDIRVSAVTK